MSKYGKHSSSNNYRPATSNHIALTRANPARIEPAHFNATRADLVSSQQLHKDPDFPTNSSSIGNRLRLNTRVVWKRPGEISTSPVFIEDGVNQHDIDQGYLGNCWFIAGAATLAASQKALFEKVVPPDQGFGDNYAGMFRFNFWWYGRWMEVVIDDYLPTEVTPRGGYKLLFASNAERPNEFWPALLEKAYAKLRGNYSDLDGGKLQDALVDLTGGISEVIDLRDRSQVLPNLYELLLGSYNMKSLMGAAIFKPDGSSESEIKMANGLYMGHAYSITSFQQLKLSTGKFINLLRVRNPWGKGEWNGAYSDGSREMRALPDDIKRTMGFSSMEEGEFWIEYSDFIRNFHEIELCHLQVDAMIDELQDNFTKQAWNVTVYHDEWIRGVTAGGCGNSPYEKMYWSNPQFYIHLKHEDTILHKSKDCTMIISLMEKEYKNTGSAETETAIGFDLYNLKIPSLRPLNGSRAPQNALILAKRSGTFQYYREVTRRFELPPGDYVVIPSTFHPNQEAKFMLRIFTEKFAESGVMEEVIDPSPKANIEDAVQVVFNKYCGPDNSLDPIELQGFLEDVSVQEVKQKLIFDLEQCRSLLPMADTSGSGRLEFKEAKQLWTEVKAYREVFLQFDKDKSNSVDTFELANMFTKLGFPVTRPILTAIVRRYGDRDNRISLQDFIVVVIKLIQVFGVYKQFEPKSEETGTAKFTQAEFIQYTMSF